MESSTTDMLDCIAMEKPKTNKDLQENFVYYF